MMEESLMSIRKIRISVAKRFLELRKKLDIESKFMMFEPNERKTKIEEEEEYIKDVLKNELSLILVCEINDQLVGYLSANRENFVRMRHSAYIVTGIVENYTGQGIGTKLFSELDTWCNSNEIHRIELTVMCHNLAGVALYKKMGFEIEGKKRHSLLIDGQYIDEYYMAKLL